MPGDVFEQNALQARKIVEMLRGETPRALLVPCERKFWKEYCVVRNGTCLTHGNDAVQCSKDRV